MLFSSNPLAAQKGDTQVTRPGGSTQNATTAISSKSFHFPKPGLPLPSVQPSLITRRESVRVCVRRPHEHRGRMARDSQLENNLVYSDGLQSMLTLGEGGSAGVQFRGHGHRA